MINLVRLIYKLYKSVLNQKLNLKLIIYNDSIIIEYDIFKEFNYNTVYNKIFNFY